MDPMTDDSGQPSFFEELKRRKVVRVAAVYGAMVFAVLQVADLLIEPLSLPEWTMRFLVLLGGLGLPVALGLAWIFEVRPEGLRRTAPAEAVPAEQIAQTSLFSRRTVLAVAALLLVGFAVGWFFAPAGVGSESPGDTAPGAALMEIRPNGIAVLPFASRSAAEGEADFFAAGLHDDLLTRLAGLEALVVISRTSVEQYRETEKSIPEIGRELAVAYVLEGGVQKAGERLRVNAQLIEARTDEHLWAETFDGDLTVADIFAIQEELVGRIVAAMEATLGEDVVANRAEAPTESLEAWEALTRGRRLWARNDLTGAEQAFEEAVQADPEFADAWARLSETASSLHWFGIERADEAREGLDWTLFLAPDRPFTDWAKATYEYYVLTSYTKALASIEQAIEKAPGHDEFHFTRGNLLRRVGDFPGAAEAFSRAAELDPRNEMYLATLAETLAWMDDDRRLERWTDAAMDIPDLGPSSIHYLLVTPLQTSRVGLARRVLERLDPELGRIPEVRLPTLWADLLDPSAEPPSTEEIRTALTDGGWTDERGIMLLLQFSSLLVLPRPDRDHLEFLLDGLDQRLRASGGAQGETFDRSVRAHVLAALGRRDEAMADARNALAWIRRTEDRFAGGPVLYNLALAFDAMGERDRAVALLEEAAPLWSFPAGLMALDPMAAELVQDPRVAALIREARSGG